MIRSEADLFPEVLTENLWLLGNYYFSLYLIRGAHASALIETGISATCDAVIGQLDSLGIAPDYIVVTHPHSDHATGLTGLCERFPRAIPIIGQGAREFVAHPKALAAMIREDRFMSKSLSERGYPVGRPPIEAFGFPESLMEVVGPHEIDLGGLTLRCLPVQGHSPGNIVVHIPEKEALMVSDSLGFHYPGRFICPLVFTGLSDYLSTVEVLAALKPRILGFGHQGSLNDAEAAAAFIAAREATLGLRDEIILNRVDARLAERLYERYYRDEFTLYSEENIIGCMRLLIRRCLEA
ncbi:MAG: MBL fold metallo-hydrolase [Pseudomonadota bacterium]